jgi:hypothetical protein
VAQNGYGMASVAKPGTNGYFGLIHSVLVQNVGYKKVNNVKAHNKAIMYARTSCALGRRKQRGAAYFLRYIARSIMFKYRFHWLFLLSPLIQSCATSHDRFIEVMDFHTKNKYTHSRVVMESGHQWANPEFLYNKVQNSKTTIYYYAYPNIFGRFCHYHFEVDNESDLIVGWGFDPDKSDPKLNCGISGGS